jgi:hypothetical protein
MSEEIESFPAFVDKVKAFPDTFSSVTCSGLEENEWLPEEVEHSSDFVDPVATGTHLPLDFVHSRIRATRKSPS